MQGLHLAGHVFSEATCDDDDVVSNVRHQLDAQINHSTQCRLSTRTHSSLTSSYETTLRNLAADTKMVSQKTASLQGHASYLLSVDTLLTAAQLCNKKRICRRGTERRCQLKLCEMLHKHSLESPLTGK